METEAAHFVITRQKPFFTYKLKRESENDEPN